MNASTARKLEPAPAVAAEPRIESLLERVLEETQARAASRSAADVPFAEVERMAAAIAKSGLFGMKTYEQALALMLISQAEGLHPALAARDYHVIQGRPSLKADAMLARFQAAGGRVRWTDYSDAKVSGVFSHPAGGEVPVTWTMDDARRAGLAAKDNWKSFPRSMMRARVISEGIRTVFPGSVVGAYTPEEIEDMTGPNAANGNGHAPVGPVTPAPLRAVTPPATEPAATDTPEVPAGADAAPIQNDEASWIAAFDSCTTWDDLRKFRSDAAKQGATGDAVLAADRAAVKRLREAGAK